MVICLQLQNFFLTLPSQTSFHIYDYTVVYSAVMPKIYGYLSGSFFRLRPVERCLQPDVVAAPFLSRSLCKRLSSMKTNHVTVPAPGQSIIASIEALLSQQNNFCTNLFKIPLTNAFALRCVICELFVIAALVIENTASFNNWCVALWIFAILAGKKAFSEFNQWEEVDDGI